MTHNFAVHRKIEEIVFEAFVKKKLSERAVIYEVIKFHTMKQGEFNNLFFNLDYCKQYASEYLKRLIKEEPFRKYGFKKHKTFEETVLSRFIHNKSNKAFLPQENIAKVFGITQKTVSIFLRKMIQAGFIRLDKKYDYGMKKANEYSLGPMGIKLFVKMTKVSKKFFKESIFTVSKEVLDHIVGAIREVAEIVFPIENKELSGLQQYTVDSGLNRGSPLK